MAENSSKTYRPYYYSSLNPVQFLSQLASDLQRSREIGWKFFKRDFVVRYRQSLLGVSWALIMPVVSVGIFLMLQRSGVLNTQSLTVPYSHYLFFGLTLWYFFTGLILSVADIAPSSKSLMATINLPKFAYVYSPMLMAWTDFLIRLLFFMALCLATKTPFNPSTYILALVYSIPLMLLALGLGLVVTVVNSIARDIKNVLLLSLQFLMFVSPVVYPLPQTSGALGAAMRLNPLSVLIDTPREVFFGKLTIPSAEYAAVGFLALIIFFIGARLYYVASPKMLEIM